MVLSINGYFLDTSVWRKYGIPQIIKYNFQGESDSVYEDEQGEQAAEQERRAAGGPAEALGRADGQTNPRRRPSQTSQRQRNQGKCKGKQCMSPVKHHGGE